MGDDAVTCGAASEILLRPDDPLTVLRGVGEKLAVTLEAAGLSTVRDLVLFFPRRHAAVVEIDAPDESALHRLVRLRGTVASTRLAWLPKRRSMVTVTLTAADGTAFEVRFFNQPYLKDAYPAGSERLVEGVLARRGKVYQVQQARILQLDRATAGPCVLHYADIPGVSTTRLEGFVAQALDRVELEGWSRERLPDELREGLPGFALAVRAMHRPTSVEEHESARLRFAVIEAVRLFRRVERSRRRRAQTTGPSIVVPAKLAARIRARFPFVLTGEQERALLAIHAMLEGPAPMGVLLQGDVGSGKTAVALGAAMAAAEQGHQVAFLAPTELLAEQHFAGSRLVLEEFGIEVHLMTSSLSPEERSEVDARLTAGNPLVVFGTHALFSESTEFGRLGFVVIDEQHRFGVEQRTRLVRKGDNPHVLYMTATPIPRTLTFTVFGDLDIVTLRERPPGRRDVPARFREANGQEWRRILDVMARRVARGQQVMVVCPKIGEESESGGAVRMQAELAKRFTVRLVHGRVDTVARQQTIDAFRDREFDVLVGTTVLEVGIDIPNATLMVVVGVDRFGLATLHQLRGRVGRGTRRGLCILTGPRGPRADAICATTNGFELAERDLEIRGAGELMGTKQSGLSDLRALDPVRDVALLGRVRDVVRREKTTE